jgi:thiol-disulfide isomerase/thioredoxin
MRKIGVVLVLVLCLFGASPFSGPARAGQPVAPAGQVFGNAKTAAAQQNKLIFLIFGASWCGPCHRLDAFLAAPETLPIVQKYFVVAKLNVDEKKGEHPELESPGAQELRAKLGGEGAGVPFVVFVDATGEPLVNSIRLVNGHAKGNVGYPAEPEEIQWFMAMLKTAVPSITDGESHAIEEWLEKAQRSHPVG